MAQTGRSNARYVDPQRRYTVVLGPSWNAPFGALPHNDRAGTHDGADGQCGSYARIGRGQAAMWITSKNFCRRMQRLGSGQHRRASITSSARPAVMTTERRLSQMSALPPKADKQQTFRFVRFVPKADIRIAALAPLLDHLVGARDQHRRYIDAKRLGCLEVDHQLEFGR